MSAIDAGIRFEGITVDTVGSLELGAYEFGKPKWTVGSNLEVPDFPDEWNSYFS